MASALFFLLLAAVASLAAFAAYMLVRIMRIYGRARRLERMRNYETIIYASLKELGPARALDLLPRPDAAALEEVLLRMAEAEGGPRDAAREMYALAGFTASRGRELRSRLASRRSGAAGRLGRMGDAGVAPQLERLLGDRSAAVREAASQALRRIAEMQEATRAPAPPRGAFPGPAKGGGAERAEGAAPPSGGDNGG